ALHRAVGARGLREGDRVANVHAAGHQHDHAIEADADAAVRGAAKGFGESNVPRAARMIESTQTQSSWHPWDEDDPRIAAAGDGPAMPRDAMRSRVAPPQFADNMLAAYRRHPD